MDVPLLLALLWLDSERVVLDPVRVQRLRAVSQPIQDEVVRPIRAARDALKALYTSASRPLPEAVALRRTILATELDAERFVLQRMEDVSAMWPCCADSSLVHTSYGLSDILSIRDKDARCVIDGLVHAARDRSEVGWGSGPEGGAR